MACYQWSDEPQRRYGKPLPPLPEEDETNQGYQVTYRATNSRGTNVSISPNPINYYANHRRSWHSGDTCGYSQTSSVACKLRKAPPTPTATQTRNAETNTSGYESDIDDGDLSQNVSASNQSLSPGWGTPNFRTRSNIFFALEVLIVISMLVCLCVLYYSQTRISSQLKRIYSWINSTNDLISLNEQL